MKSNACLLILHGVRFDIILTSQGLRAKIHARDKIYLSLRDQAGPEFSAATAEHLAIEETVAAGDPFASPRATGRELRYEWRAHLLEQQGVIDEVITHAGHFIPIVQALLADRSIPSGILAPPKAGCRDSARIGT